MVLAVAYLGLCAPSPARAEVANLDGVSVSLEVPKNYCALSRSHPVDKLTYEQQDRMQAATNTVVSFLVPCAELELIRKGKPASRWALWLMAGPAGNPMRLPPTISRDAAIAELAKAMPSLDFEEVIKNVDDMTRKEGVAVKMSNSGVIDKDHNGLYVGSIANLEKGALKRELAVVIGWTFISGRGFTLNLYSDFENRGTFDVLLETTKDTLARSVIASDAIVVDKSLPPGMKPFAKPVQKN